MNNKLTAAMLAVILVMITPAHAAQMDITKYAGVDEVNGYARSNDQIIIEATAQMYGNPTMEVAARRLKIYHSGISERFQSCSTAGQATYKCTYTTTGAYAGQQQFRIELLDADGKAIETADKTITIDSMAPLLTLFDITPRRGTNNKATISYGAEDYSRTTGDTSSCSGIKEIAFYVNNQKVAAEAGQRELCSKENTIEYTRNVLSYEKINMCARAIDMLSQQSDPICKEYEIDNQAPQIKEVQIKDADGFVITGVRTAAGITASVEAIIEGNGDDVDIVTADFSSLNPSLAGERTPDEHYLNNYIWKNVQITNPSNCQVTIKAKDTLGNEAVKTAQCTLPVDNAGPEGVKIETNYTDEDSTMLIGAKGTIKLEIREAGAGLYKKHVYMDLSNLGRQYSTQQRADNCHIKTGDVWECTWNIEPKTRDGDKIIKLSPATRDDLDNPISLPLEKTIRVDTAPPTIEEIKFSAVHAFAEYGQKTVKGDTVKFEIKSNGVFYAYANFTGLGGGYTPGTCGGQTTRTCEFTQTITKSGPDNATIEFELFDRAGNKEVYRHDLIIYGLADDYAPEYWNSTAECSPSLIDRSTTTQKEQIIFCHINLKTTNQDASPVHTSIDTSLSECYPSENLAGIAEIQMMNNGYGSKDPYMAITLSLSEFAVNELNFSCPVHIATQIGNYFSKTDEKEIIDVKLEFYNLPIGEMYDSTEKNINHAMRKAINWMDWIDNVEKYTEMTRKMCGYKTTLTSLLSALDGIFALFPPLYSLMYASGQTEKVDDLEAFRRSMCNEARGPAEQFFFGAGKEYGKGEKIPVHERTIVQRIAGVESSEAKFAQDFWEFLDMFCDFLNCRLTWSDERYKELSASGDLGEYAGGFLVGAGGGGWGKNGELCKSAENLASLGMGKTIEEYNKLSNQMQSRGEPRQQLTDVKESLFWSTLCFCGPGIIHNINKMRQISCKYALCLAEDVKNQGIDASWCTAEKAYLTCTYVMGEIFAITPLLAFYDKAVNTVKEWFENPLSLLGAVSGCLCGGCKELLGINPFCEREELLMPTEGSPARKPDALRQAAGYVICILPKTAAKIMDAIASIKSMPAANAKEFEIGDSYCLQAKSIGLDKRYGK